MKNKFLLFILILSPLLVSSQTSTISGVITYFFNDNYGNRPDIGAKVFIIDSATNNSFKYMTVDSFIYAKTYKGIYNSYLSIYSNYNDVLKKYEGKKLYKTIIDQYKLKADDAKKDVDKYYQVLEKYGVETKDKFDALDKRALSSVLGIDENNSLQKSVDGAGNYSVNVKPGVYYVLVVSKNRNGSNATELMGQVYHKKITIKENSSKDISHNFGIY